MKQAVHFIDSLRIIGNPCNMFSSPEPECIDIW